jgi:uncharacterized protein YndB with AHSA1/START domain
MSQTTELEVARIRRIEMEIAIAAPIERVWQCIVAETSAWWPAGHFANGDSKTFRLEPWVGGRMFEESGDGNGVLWYTVLSIDAPNSIEFAGHTSIKWGGPSTSILSLNLKVSGEGTTLQLTDAAFGRVTEDQDTAEGWRSLFETYFKAYAERGA